jgi:hypothetical protein
MRTLAILAFVMFATTPLVATTPFTKDSDFHDWRAASLSYRAEWCDYCASIEQKVAPGITGDFIFGSLQAFSDNAKSDDDPVLNEKLVEIMSLTVAVWVHRQQDGK